MYHVSFNALLDAMGSNSSVVTCSRPPIAIYKLRGRQY